MKKLLGSVAATALLAFAALLPAVAAAADMKSTELVAGAAQRLVFEHPATWQATATTAGAMSVLQLGGKGAGGGGDFVIYLTVLPAMHGVPASEQELVAMVRREGEGLLPTAVQKSLELQAVKGPQVVGSLYHLTDRKPEGGPGDYREMRQGAVLVGKTYLAVRILTHSDDQATVEAALRMLAAAQPRGSGPSS